MTLDAVRSREVAERINSKARKPFDNAYHAALVIEGALYVQGFLILPGKPYRLLEHGWLELEDCIIDPSLPHLHQPPENLRYFPAQRLTVTQLKAAVEEAREDYPEDDPLPIYGSTPYEYYGDVMLGGQEYLTAYQAAEAQCHTLMQQLADRN